MPVHTHARARALAQQYLAGAQGARRETRVSEPSLHRALRESREDEIKKLLVELEQRRQSDVDDSAHLLLQEEVLSRIQPARGRKSAKTIFASQLTVFSLTRACFAATVAT